MTGSDELLCPKVRDGVITQEGEGTHQGGTGSLFRILKKIRTEVSTEGTCR